MATPRPPRPICADLLRPQLRFRPVRPPCTPRIAVRHKSGPYGYTQAKALVLSKYGEPSDVLNLHTHSISPTLPARSALVRTLAAPINPADINTLQGTYGALPPFTTDLGTPLPSACPGSEALFEVLATGAGTTTLTAGDWALPAGPGAQGTWRTHALVADADTALQRVARAGLTPVQAATAAVNPASAARLLRGFVDLVAVSVRQCGAGAAGGAWWVQNGANGGVGRAAVQLGRLAGLRSINVVRARETEAETRGLKEELLGLGATVVVTEEEFQGRGFADRVKGEWTRGGRDPIMLGLNCVGGKSAGAVARCLGEGGTMVTYGAMARQPVRLPTGLLIFKDLSFRGFWLSRWSRENREEKRKLIEEILDLMREGKFKEAPVQEIPWTWETKEGELREAVQGTLEGFRKGKGVFVFPEDT